MSGAPSVTSWAACLGSGVAGREGDLALSMDETTAGTQPANSSGSSLGDDCPGCGGHSMALGACLLALTLLVLSWWLAPPRVRHLPPRMLWRAATVATLLGRWVPALSLAELSVLRT